MKLNKEKFLKTELGAEIKNCIECWDYAIENVKSEKNDYLRQRKWEISLQNQAKWEAFQLALKHFYGIEYHFTRTDDYYGLVTEDERDWLFKVERRWNSTSQ